MIRELGRLVRLALRELGGLLALFFQAFALIAALRVRPKESLEQAFEIGNRSLVFLSVTMGFIGMIMVLQSGYQAQRLIGDYTLLGPAFMQLLIREFAPTIGALMIATRVGAGIAAELGSMTVTEQIDALRLSGTDPVEELVVPRLLSGLIMVPALVVLAAVAAETSGIFTARLAFEVPFRTFASVRLVMWGDLAVGLVKAVIFGAVIPVISARAGFLAVRGAEGVGLATTRAVIHTSVAIIFLDFVINILLYPLYAR